MLRDRLVCGVRHKGIQRKLLSESDLSFERAYSLAQSAEASERDALKLSEKSQGHSHEPRTFPLAAPEPELRLVPEARAPEQRP